MSRATYEIDKLITEAKKQRLASAERIAAGNRRADITTAKIGAQSREQVAMIGGKAGISQTRMQQEGATARQRLTQAGDLVLQELRGRQAVEQQKVSDIAALGRVQEAGVQTRKTTKKKFDLESLDLTAQLEQLYPTSSYAPPTTDVDETEKLSQYLSF